MCCPTSCVEEMQSGGSGPDGTACQQMHTCSAFSHMTSMGARSVCLAGLHCQLCVQDCCVCGRTRVWNVLHGTTLLFCCCPLACSTAAARLDAMCTSCAIMGLVQSNGVWSEHQLCVFRHPGEPLLLGRRRVSNGLFLGSVCYT